MQDGLTTCLGCRQTYYARTRQAALHHGCKIIWCVVVNKRIMPDVVVNKLVVNRSLDRHNKDKRRDYMRDYMRQRRAA